jgi:hypothetical protein
MLVNECLCGDFRDQVGWRLDVILMSPGQLLRRRVATAMFPTLTRRCATAPMMLAGERRVRRFVDGRRQRDSEGGNEIRRQRNHHDELPLPTIACTSMPGAKRHGDKGIVSCVDTQCGGSDPKPAACGSSTEMPESTVCRRVEDLLGGS